MTTTADIPTATGTGLGFTTDRASMADALITVGLAVSQRPAAPSLGGALLQAQGGHLTISATDLQGHRDRPTVGHRTHCGHPTC